MYRNSFAIIAIIASVSVVSACGVVGPSNEDRDRLLNAFFATLSENWSPQDVEPLVTSEAYEIMISDQQAQLFRVLSRLGRLDSLGSFLTNHVSASTGAGVQAHAQGTGTFENGDASITVVMGYEDDELRIHSFNIESPLFLQLIDPGSPTTL